MDNYDFETHDKKDENGVEVNSFAQLIWKGAGRVGTGIAPTEDGKFVYGIALTKDQFLSFSNLVVCRYLAKDWKREPGKETVEKRPENVFPIK